MFSASRMEFDDRGLQNPDRGLELGLELLNGVPPSGLSGTTPADLELRALGSVIGQTGI
jgi:hypothetical protein